MACSGPSRSRDGRGVTHDLRSRRARRWWLSCGRPHVAGERMSSRSIRKVSAFTSLLASAALLGAHGATVGAEPGPSTACVASSPAPRPGSTCVSGLSSPGPSAPRSPGPAPLGEYDACFLVTDAEMEGLFGLPLALPHSGT